MVVEILIFDSDVGLFNIFWKFLEFYGGTVAFRVDFKEKLFVAIEDPR